MSIKKKCQCQLVEKIFQMFRCWEMVVVNLIVIKKLKSGQLPSPERAGEMFAHLHVS